MGIGMNTLRKLSKLEEFGQKKNVIKKQKKLENVIKQIDSSHHIVVLNTLQELSCLNFDQ